MQKLLSQVRKCVRDYQMLSPGDRVAVGVSEAISLAER